MSSIKSIFISYLFLVTFNSSAQNFIKAYEDSVGVSFKDYIKCRDGGFLLYGGLYYGFLSDRGLIVKTDSEGDIEWSKKVTSFPILHCLETSTGGFYIIGSTAFVGTSSLFKADSVGNLIWSRSFEFSSNYSIPLSVILLNNDQLVTATSGVVGINGEEMCYARIDSSGNEVWVKRFGTGNSVDDQFQYAKLSPDSFIYSIAIIGSNGALIKMDLNGNVIWCKSKSEAITDIEILSSSEMVLTSQWTSVMPYSSIISKCDSSGLIYQSICFASSDTVIHPEKLIAIDHHNYKLLGHILPTNSLQDDRRFIVVFNDSSQILSGVSLPDSISNFDYPDQNADPAYLVYIKEEANQIPKGIFCHYDNTNSFCIGVPLTFDTVAFTESFYQNHSLVTRSETIDLYSGYSISPANVYSSDYCGLINTVSSTEKSDVLFYPNPFSNVLNLKIPFSKDYILCISDINGIKVVTEKFSNSLSLSTEKLKSGVYFYQLISESVPVNWGKLIKLD